MLNLYPLCMAEVYQNGYSIFKFSHFYIVWFIFALTSCEYMKEEISTSYEMLISSFIIDSGILLLPPVPTVMEDIALAFLAVAFLQERYLIAEAELDELADVEVCLRAGLKIKIVPDTVSETEADVMTCFLAAGTIRSRIH